MESTRIAHLSDLHMTLETSPLEKTLAKHLKALAPDLILVTGDVSLNGTPLQQKKAKEYFDQFSAKTLFIPGNTDYAIEEASGMAVAPEKASKYAGARFTAYGLTEADYQAIAHKGFTYAQIFHIGGIPHYGFILSAQPDRTIIPTKKTDPLAPFKEYLNPVPVHLHDANLSIVGIDSSAPAPFVFTYKATIGKEELVFVPLHDGYAPPHQLQFALDQFSGKPGDLRILMVHNPPLMIPGVQGVNDHANPEDILQTAVDAGVHLILCGHRHRPNMQTIYLEKDKSAVPLRMLAAGPTLSDDIKEPFTGNTYHVLQVGNNRVDIDLVELQTSSRMSVGGFTF